MSLTVSIPRRRIPRNLLGHGLRLVSIGALVWIVACSTSDDLPAMLQPAPGTVVRYAVASNVRCKNVLEPYTAADGKPGGDQCVNDHVLHLICKAAAHCEQIPYRPGKKP